MSQEDLQGAQKNKKKLLGGKTGRVLLIVLLVIVLLTAVGVSGYFIWRERSQNVCSGSAAGTAFFEEAAEFIAPGNSGPQLKPYAERVLATKGYDKSPSCLYILTIYSIGIGDATASRNYYDQLVKVYNPDKGYDKGFGEAPLSPDQTLPIIDFLEAQQANPSGIMRNAPQL